MRWLPLPGVKNAYPMLFTGLLLLVILPIENLPSFSADLVSGLGAFLLGWGLSGLLVTGKWATIVGLFSFGVYLVHQIFLELIQAVFPYTEPVGVIGILAITITVYIASMLTVGLANRSGNLAQRIFGLK